MSKLAVRKAWNKGMINKVKRSCMQCGKNYQAWPSQRQKFCGLKCCHESKKGKPSGSTGIKWTAQQRQKIRGRKGLSGSQNPNWAGGIKKYYTTNFRRKLNKLVKQRDGFKCTQCNSEKSLIVHHIDHNHRNDSLTNLITWCRSCHGRHHHGK